MTTTIRKEFRALSVAERIELIGALWDELTASGIELELAPAQLAELERRRASYRKKPERALPWTTAKAGILKRHARRRRST